MTVAPTIGIYDVGDLVRLSATFLSTDFITAADPSTIWLLYKNPLGSVASYQYNTGLASITRASVGAYYKDITVDTFGRWYYRFQGTGGVQVAEEWQFDVSQSQFLL